jgi:hypothetical protein
MLFRDYALILMSSYQVERVLSWLMGLETP